MLRRDFRGEVWTNIYSEVLNAIVTANAEIVDGDFGEDGYSVRAAQLVQNYFKEKYIRRTR